MAITTRDETIPMPDGGSMGAYVAIPEAGAGPGMLVLMEIFGVSTYIRGATDRLAEHGYVALAPDLYRRTRPGAEFGKGPEGLREAFAAVSELEVPGAIEDATAALGTLRTLPEVSRGTGVIGFCLGGTLAFGVAVGGDPDTLVAYYGSGIPEMLGDADAIGCPALFHFGAEDPYIPLEQSRRVAETAESRPDWEVHIQPDGGHAFDNWDNPMFYQPGPAARAWDLTRDFLARTLPAG
ncbi:MAG: dienelactone hydrolase family protein [Solirubrobacteraceae bacterium]